MTADLSSRALGLLSSFASHGDNLDQPDVILIQAPCWGVEMPPYGLACLTSFLREAGAKVLGLDLNIECYNRRSGDDVEAWDYATSHAFWSTPENAAAYIEANRTWFDALVELLVDTQPRLIGFSVQYSSLPVTMQIARLIRKRAPHIPIVLGGPQAARYNWGEQVLQTGAVDLLCTGEGEETLLELVTRLRAGQPIEGTPGTISLVDGVAVDGPARPLIKKLDSLPYADFDDFSGSVYTHPTVLPLATSRGCVNRCSFCSEVAYWTRYRGFSGQRIFDEVVYQLKRRPEFKVISFQDSLINGRLKEIDRFGELLAEAGMSVGWSGQAIMRKDLSKDRMLRMKEAGCTHLSFGMESGSTAVLVGVGKNAMRGTDADQIARDAHEVGLNCSYNFMFGLPGENRAEFEESLRFLRDNRDNVLRVNPSTGLCAFPPGTEGYDHPERFGIVNVESIHYWESLDGTNTFPERLRRFEAFVALAHELGVPCSYPHSTMKGRERKLVDYYMHMEDFQTAEEWLGQALEVEPDAADLHQKLALCREARSGAQTTVASKRVSVAL